MPRAIRHDLRGPAPPHGGLKRRPLSSLLRWVPPAPPDPAERAPPLTYVDVRAWGRGLGWIGQRGTAPIGVAGGRERRWAGPGQSFPPRLGALSSAAAGGRGVPWAPSSSASQRKAKSESWRAERRGAGTPAPGFSAHAGPSRQKLTCDYAVSHIWLGQGTVAGQCIAHRLLVFCCFVLYPFLIWLQIRPHFDVSEELF